jgi:hypothetical protein
MIGKLYAQFVSPADRDERYVRLECNVSPAEGVTFGEIYFPNVDSDLIMIKFYAPTGEIDALEFSSFLQQTIQRLSNERAPKGQRRAEDIVWDEDKSETENKV